MSNSITDALTQEERDFVASHSGLLGLLKVQQLERDMLSRAIEVLHKLTGKTPEVIIGLLSIGPDSDPAYVEQVTKLDEKNEQRAQGVTKEPKQPLATPAKGLFLPNRLKDAPKS